MEQIGLVIVLALLVCCWRKPCKAHAETSEDLSMTKPETIAGLKPDKPNPFVSMAVYGLSVLMLRAFH